jgi:hypothetical protein
MTVKTQFQTIVTSALLLLPALTEAQELTREYRLLIAWVIALVFLFVASIVAISLFIQHLSAKRHAELIEQFLEKGQDIPPELLAQTGWPGLRRHAAAEPDHSRSMRRGVSLLALAFAIAVLFYVGSGDLRAAAWGLPFLCLSIASFINGKFFSPSGPSERLETGNRVGDRK